MTTTPPLVGILGKARAGKDSFAAVLADEYGFARASFAAPLKDAALRLDPLVGPCALPMDWRSHYRRLSEVIGVLGWERAKDVVPGVRETLQRLGTDAIRALDEDFWVRIAMRQALALRIDGPDTAPGRPVVFADVRFPNEAEAIRDAGGYLVRVTRPGTGGGSHVSETALDDFEADFEVYNDEELDWLQLQARWVAEDVGALV